MSKKTTAGTMRLNREGKMNKRDIEAEIKKTGKIAENFICLPDPDDCFKWWYIIFGLDMDPYRGGFYLGYVLCPDDYPAKAPKITLVIDNGRFRTVDQQEGICLSVSHYHPESWNPAWKVKQIVTGLQQFWMGGEYTYGSTESHDYPKDLDIKERSYGFAIDSRTKVMNHEKFKLFEPYADAIGIKVEPEVKEWVGFKERQAKRDAEKKAKDEIKRKADEARLAKEAEEKKKAEQKAKARAIKEYFKLLKAKDLTKYVGQPEHARKAMKRLQA